MKNSNFFFTFALALLVIFQSCKKNDVAEVAAPAAAAQTENIAALSQAVAASVGIAADKVEFNKTEKEFVIDGDVTVSLEDAKARFTAHGVAGAANEATHMKTPYVVASSKVNLITVYCDATVPATWVAAMDSAIKNWNATGSKVAIKRVTTSTATTRITTTYNTTLTVATASYPDYYGNAGNKIAINTYYNGMLPSKKIFAITHELGHTLGLSHTNGTYGTLVAGTPVTDASSVMNAVCLYWSAFSSYDLQAIRTVYPK